MPDGREADAKQTSGRTPAGILGDVMTGTRIVSVISVGTIGLTSSDMDPRLAVARPARNPILVSGIFHSVRLAARTVSAFTTGIRGTPPPPLG